MPNMVKQDTVDLPVIDFAALNEKDASGQRTSTSINERHRLFTALRDTGFAYLKHPGVNQSTVDELFAHSRRFFAKPLDQKMQILGQLEKGRGPSQGYSNPLKLAHNPQTSDLKEFFGMYRDDDTEKPNQWLGDADSRAMRADLVRFFDSCHGVIRELLSALAEEVGLAAETLHPAIGEKNHFIACLHYPATEPESFRTRVRAAAHTDYGCMTLLFNDAGEGLQVLRQDGQYEYVPRKDDCAVLNVGDLLSRFFNGLLPSTMHRVVEPPATRTGASTTEVPDRYSIAFFGHFNLDVLVKPLEALVSAANPARFEPVVAGEHVKARVKQLHVAGHSLKDNEQGVESRAAVAQPAVASASV
ncbi:isopenicillin N synthase family dioxygenase [Aspergillus clavatus NRRL 1]|uniref:Oxidoreductase, putative n=1 Tax=Aspergillus clavatus (strain ATCC 1007 / CBS 513.65 / DSM 816 / NCTC 3887 / NRRL 1 / QM 1276 / 107) TaxID=344612 RepID=A1CLP8_ASPCL|nr:oxidoreductase, putative [Aspergillus clavatus NRRL 1]EAW09027.1 oxidoreductase, putative [Aspergillus clavatus NRRL 1]